MAKTETSKTSLEYLGNVAVIHLGRNVDERVEKAESLAEKAAGKKEVRVLVLDYENVDCAMSRDGCTIIVANDIFSPREVYLCNAGENIRGLVLLGITSLAGVYVKGTLEETLAELAN